LNTPGVEGEELVFHGAVYFVPQLIYYGGGRREEFCGLMVDDVILENAPYRTSILPKMSNGASKTFNPRGT
jgi:hypothetical protein